MTIDQVIYDRLNHLIRTRDIPKQYGVFYRGQLLSITTNTGKFFSKTGTAKSVFNRHFKYIENTLVPAPLLLRDKLRSQKENILKGLWESKELEIKELT